MEVTYRKNLSGSYMCVEEEGQLIEPYEVQMLEQYCVPCLLRMQTTMSEGRRRYLYDISGKQQMADYFAGKKIGYDTLRMFLFSIYDVCGRLSEYLLREEGLCLELEFIYVNLEDGSLQFTYLPFYEKNLQEAFQGFMERLLREIDHQDKAAVELGYQVYRLCTNENARIGNLLEKALERQTPEEEQTVEDNVAEDKWEDEKTDKTNMAQSCRNENWQKAAELIKKYLPGISAVAETVRNRLLKAGNAVDRKSHVFTRKKGMPVQIQRKHRRKQNLVFSEIPQGEAAKKEEDAPLRPIEILGVRQREPLGKLVYHGVHLCSDIPIEGDNFLLGKNSEQVNGIILAEGVSRLHARITRVEGNYFIEDLNSTNGTYLNDVMLEYHQPRQIQPKDKIRFGVEEYVFL